MGELTRERLMEITKADLENAARESDGDTLEKAAVKSTVSDLLASAQQLKNALSQAEPEPAKPETAQENTEA